MWQTCQICGGGMMDNHNENHISNTLSDYDLIELRRKENQDEINQLKDENERLRKQLQSLFDRCMLADEQGELSELISGELLDSVGALLGFTPENEVKEEKYIEMAVLKALNEVTK